MEDSSKSEIQGIGRVERENLAKLLRESRATISVSEAAGILDLKPVQAAKLLSKYAKKGWLKRIKHGVYMAVPLNAIDSNVIAEEPFVIAEKIFSPCYIGGMNAASYWDLTEQIFNTTTVMTQKLVKSRNALIAGNKYIIRTIKPLYFFGLKSAWFDNVKVSISDPSRTIVDMLMFPNFCGGMRFIIDVLNSYNRSEYKDFKLLISYLAQAKNGAAIKRMGFLAEKYLSDEIELLEFCKRNLTKGYAKLSSSLDCPRLETRWRLWVPQQWKIKND